MCAVVFVFCWRAVLWCDGVQYSTVLVGSIVAG